jgi:hypothetical protein
MIGLADSCFADSIQAELARILSSTSFAGTTRSRVILQFLVEQTIHNRSDRLKEHTLGAEALGRGPDFDPRTDPIVRAEAHRLVNVVAIS